MDHDIELIHVFGFGSQGFHVVLGLVQGFVKHHIIGLRFFFFDVLLGRLPLSWRPPSPTVFAVSWTFFLLIQSPTLIIWNIGYIQIRLILSGIYTVSHCCYGVADTETALFSGIAVAQRHRIIFQGFVVDG